MVLEDMLLMVMVVLMATWNFLDLSTIEHLVEGLAFDSCILLDFFDVPVGQHTLTLMTSYCPLTMSVVSW